MMTLTKQANNFHTVSFRNFTIYFSYETVIGFSTLDKLFAAENEWGTTTGKHINMMMRGEARKPTEVMPHGELKEVFAIFIG